MVGSSCNDGRMAGRTKGVRTLALGHQREEGRRDTSPLKGLKVRDETEESPRLKDKVQRIVWGQPECETGSLRCTRQRE